jgi:surface protein
MSKIVFRKKTGNDFLALSFGKPRYFNETDINMSVNWGDGSTQIINSITSAGVQRRTITYKVKVETRSGHANTNQFILYDESGAIEIGEVILEEGNNYIFDQSDSSNSTHPLLFSLSSEGATYSTGVTVSGTPGTEGAQTQIDISEGDSTTGLSTGIFIKCGAHSNMGLEVGSIDVDQQSVTLWHLYNSNAARRIVINGGFGSASNVTDASLKLCMAERGSRSPCANHEEIEEIGFGSNLWVHGEGDFEDMPIKQGKFNPAMSALDSADPAALILKTAGDDGNIRCLYTFKGTKCRTAAYIKKFFNEIDSSSVSLTSTQGCFQDSSLNQNGIKFGTELLDTSFMFKNSKWTLDLFLNVAKVTTMESMLEGSIFNKGINNWRVGKVISMKNMFKNSKFNKPITAWFSTNKLVQDFSGMFEGASFNGNIKSWRTGSVTDMSFMFKDNTSFSSTALYWDTKNVTNIESMFEGATSSPAINGFNVQKVVNAKNLFKNSLFNNNITNWFKANNVLENMEGMFEGAKFTGAVRFWTNNVTNMSFLFKNNKVWDQATLFLKTTNVTTFEGMFHDSICNPKGLVVWDTANVTTIKNMFYGSKCTSPLKWFKTAQSLLDMTGVFGGDSSFNHGSLSNWNTSTVTNMSGVFLGNTNFNKDLIGWDTSSVTDMSEMFNGATSFNYSIRSWDVSKVVSMKNMFKNSNFNPSHPQELAYWFGSKNYKNQPNPATYAIEDMSGMFDGSKYNKKIDFWNKHKPTVKKAIRMFADNTVQSVANIRNLFSNSPLLEDVSAIFEGSFSIQGGQNQIGRWPIFKTSSSETKKKQINVLFGNAYRGKINNYDYTSQEQSQEFSIPSFILPDPLPADVGKLDCVSLYKNRPAEEDSLNTIYFHIVDPA